jgi:signal transduction histidine kinase
VNVGGSQVAWKALARGLARCGAPAGLPPALAWLFWADLALLGTILGGAVVRALAGAMSAPMVAVFAVNLVAVVCAWLVLPRASTAQDPGPPSRRPAAPLLFLVATLALGSTGTRGEQIPATLVALTVLAATWGLRAAAGAMVVIDGLGLVTEHTVYHVDPWTSVVRALMFGAAQVFVLAMVRALATARQAEGRAVELNRRLRELTIADERARMAGEMHDTVGHDLMVVTLDLQNALRLRRRDGDAAWRQVAQARDDVGVALQHVRRAVRALRPVDLAGRGLRKALIDLAALFDGTGMRVQVTVDGAVEVLPPDHQLIVLRAVQEGVLNAVRHSGADRVAVHLTCADAVRLTVVDNGRGAAADRLNGGFGLRELANRVRAHRGVLQVDGTRGVQIILRLPAGAAT